MRSDAAKRLHNPLNVGTRVRHVTHGFVGTVVRQKGDSRRMTYSVRWDGYDHDSGEYGVRSLERP